MKTQLAICEHCGDNVPTNLITEKTKQFCCEGCHTVYHLLQRNGLNQYYTQNKTPGLKTEIHQFAFLDDPQTEEKLIDFKNTKIIRFTVHLPAIHCSSCLYLLERLYQIDSRIIHTQVNFHKKTALVTFLHNDISLREVVELLSNIGYTPDLNFSNLTKKEPPKTDKTLLKKLGVAGFCFGNIMMNSFPEYFGDIYHTSIQSTFAYLNFVLALPVLFYSATEYFISAYKSIKIKHINIDVPVSIGIIALFLKSCTEIFSGQSIGFMDSFAGFVFFLLIGKLFQSKTYSNLSFNRDYASFFPIAATRVEKDDYIQVPLSQIMQNQTLLVRNREIIPCDGILTVPYAEIDYSFVSGESDPVQISEGEKLYAGGRVVGKSLLYKTEKTVNQSYLTSLWNSEDTTKAKDETQLDRVAMYFTMGVIVFAFLGFFLWIDAGISQAIDVAVSVLIVACPCALALSMPFTLGTTLNIFAKKGLFLKSVHSVEKMSKIRSIVFDKTGTLSLPNSQSIEYTGIPLSDTEKEAIHLICSQSTHPLSKKIAAFLNIPYTKMFPDEFLESEGKGLIGRVGDLTLILGSSTWLQEHGVKCANTTDKSTRIHLSINTHYKGSYSIKHSYRNGLSTLLKSLSRFPISLLSGDTSQEKNVLQALFPSGSTFHFSQSPEQKKDYIHSLSHPLMVGDGLNDAIALKAAYLGFSVSNDTLGFVPACDGILKGNSLTLLNRFLRFSTFSMRVVVVGYIISICYNTLGLSYALFGNLTPLVSAILMPLSSLTIIAFTTLSISVGAHFYGLNRREN